MDWIHQTREFLGHWGSEMGQWTVILFRITVIIVIAWLIRRALHKAVGGLRHHLTKGLDDVEGRKRAETLGRVIRYLVSVVVVVVATMLVLSEIGISLAPILGAAGVVGLAVGFGAQSLVRDYFSGFFMLLENQIRQGDIVTLAGQTGSVEEVTLRYVQLRDYAGHVYFIPNGQITMVINMTRGFAYAVIDAGVSYREDMDQVMAIMRRVAVELRQDPEFGPRILQDLEMAGVNEWANSAVVIRARLRCQSQENFVIRREYLKRLMQAFDAEGIKPPAAT
jgi:small conductance mechanosensitive channel